MKNDVVRIGVVFTPDAPIYSPERTTDDPTDPYFGPLLRGLQSSAIEHRLEIVYGRHSPLEYLRFTRAESLAGLIILAFGLDDSIELSSLRSEMIPHVVVGVSNPKGKEDRIPSVDASNVEGGRMAARHLLDLGHRSLGCINLAGNFANHCDRMYGFIEQIKEAGLGVDFDWMLMDDGYAWPLFEEQISTWLRALKDRNNLPTAIFACDFMMVDALYQALSKLGLAIPSDMSVIGFDDPPPGRSVAPSLTTVRQPVEAIAKCAVERLAGVLGECSKPNLLKGSIILPTELVVRESTAPEPSAA